MCKSLKKIVICSSTLLLLGSFNVMAADAGSQARSVAAAAELDARSSAVDAEANRAYISNEIELEARAQAAEREQEARAFAAAKEEQGRSASNGKVEHQVPDSAGVAQGNAVNEYRYRHQKSYADRTRNEFRNTAISRPARIQRPERASSSYRR